VLGVGVRVLGLGSTPYHVRCRNGVRLPRDQILGSGFRVLGFGCCLLGLWCWVSGARDMTHICDYGVATISRSLKIIGLFCKRAL